MTTSTDETMRESSAAAARQADPPASRWSGGAPLAVQAVWASEGVATSSDLAFLYADEEDLQKHLTEAVPGITTEDIAKAIEVWGVTRLIREPTAERMASLVWTTPRESEGAAQIPPTPTEKAGKSRRIKETLDAGLDRDS